MEEICAVVLAAGKGRRMQSRTTNKVTLEVGGKPMVLRTLEVLKDSGIKNIIVVVGFAKDSVTKLLDKEATTVEQKKRLGTGHAVKSALPKIPSSCKYILVVYGDDSYLYTPQTFKRLLEKYKKEDLDIIFLSTSRDNPQGLGRIERGGNGRVLDIVEEKNASEEQRKIKEVNLGGFLFKTDFVRKNINSLPKNTVSGEYYITDLIKIAVREGLVIDTLELENVKWQGVNTPADLLEAQKLI